MREASVLHTTSIEVFFGILFQCHGHFFRTECYRSDFFDDAFICQQIKDFHQSGLLIQFNPYSGGSQGDISSFLFHRQSGNFAPGLVDKYLCFRLCLGITNDTAGIVLKDTENIFSVKVDSHPLPVWEQYINRRRIYFLRTENARCLFLPDGCRRNVTLIRSYGCLYR